MFKRIAPALLAAALLCPVFSTAVFAQDRFEADDQFPYVDRYGRGLSPATDERCDMWSASSGGPYDADREAENLLNHGNIKQAAARYLTLARSFPVHSNQYYLGYHELYGGDPIKAAFYLHDNIYDEAELENAVAWLHRQGSDAAAFKMLKMRSDDWSGGSYNDTCGQNVRQKLFEACLAERIRPLEPQEVGAFGLKRFKQPHLSVYFSPHNSQFDQRFQAIFIDALNQWCAASNNGLSFEIVSVPSKANIVAKWSPYMPTMDNNFFDTGTARACGIEGYCRIACNPQDTGIINQATVEVPVFLNIGSHLRDLQCSQACLHELGHAIGIVPHSTASRDVLGLRHYSDARPLARLTEHDRTTARVLYAPGTFRRALSYSNLRWRPPNTLNVINQRVSHHVNAPLPTELVHEEAVRPSHNQTDEFDIAPPTGQLVDPFIVADLNTGSQSDSETLPDAPDVPLDATAMSDAFELNTVRTQPQPPALEGATNGTILPFCKHSLGSKHRF